MVATAISRERVMDWLAEVADPEIPVLSIIDLGIVRDVIVGDGVTVALSPTYSGCPATEVIEHSVIAALEKNGVEDVRIRRVLSPPWTTDWISPGGREKLLSYGIAPPAGGASKRALLDGSRDIGCPRCGSRNTAIVSEFGSTACKALHYCHACRQPFEHFKCH